MTTTMRPYPDPSDSLDVALWAAENDAARDAADLAAEARRLADRLHRLAVRLTDNPLGSSVNPLGELQASGPAFDVLCANLNASRHTVAVLRKLISERTAS